jgi:elongation factor P
MDLQIMTTDGTVVIDYVLPTTVVYNIVEAEVAVVGNTSGAVTKKVKTDTGLSVTVPNFVNEGDTIKVDTRDGSYVGRG